MKRLTEEDVRLLRMAARLMQDERQPEIVRAAGQVILAKVVPLDGNEVRTLDVKRARELVRDGLEPIDAARRAIQETGGRALMSRITHVARMASRQK